MEMLVYFCGIELVPFASCFPPLYPPSLRSFQQSELFPQTAGHTVMTLISLSASFFSSIAHSFLLCLDFFFLSSLLSIAHFPLPYLCCSLFHLYLSSRCVSFFFFPSPPYSPVLDIPRHCVCVSNFCVYSSVRAYLWQLSNVARMRLYACVHTCMLYFLVLCLQQPLRTASLKMINHYRCPTGFGIEL